MRAIRIGRAEWGLPKWVGINGIACLCSNGSDLKNYNYYY